MRPSARHVQRVVNLVISRNFLSNDNDMVRPKSLDCNDLKTYVRDQREHKSRIEYVMVHSSMLEILPATHLELRSSARLWIALQIMKLKDFRQVSKIFLCRVILIVLDYVL